MAMPTPQLDSDYKKRQVKEMTNNEKSEYTAIIKFFSIYPSLSIQIAKDNTHMFLARLG